MLLPGTIVETVSESALETRVDPARDADNAMDKAPLTPPSIATFRHDTGNLFSVFFLILSKKVMMG